LPYIFFLYIFFLDIDFKKYYYDNTDITEYTDMDRGDLDYGKGSDSVKDFYNR
jgi:hypothetical protein